MLCKQYHSLDFGKKYQSSSICEKKRQVWSTGRILYAFSYSSRTQVMQLLYGPFSMTPLIVVYLFPCKRITGQIFAALFRKINNSNRKNSINEKKKIFPVSIAHMNLGKFKNLNIDKLLLRMRTGFLQNLVGYNFDTKAPTISCSSSFCFFPGALSVNVISFLD